ncbi:MAG TPA: GntR family transcriptional regulator [Pelobium sp.]|jgi:DNA-binding transcriptional regulator YhcF (GntR family)|nr:GntR family transcriptional regulator [Pelobium sp.]
MELIFIDKQSSTTKVMQIFNFIVEEIESERLKRDTQLPSITIFSKRNAVSRDTVEKAYKKLIKEGYVKAVKGKGNFILEKRDKRTKILLLFNKLSSYKKIIYDAFLDTLGDNVRVDLHIHHYSPAVLEEIITENLDSYHHYVVMPHFFHGIQKKDYMPILMSIPSDKLLLLDKHLELTIPHKAVYQNFKFDIYDALRSVLDLIAKYDGIIVVFPQHSQHPVELTEGVMTFCLETNKQFSVITATTKENIHLRTMYVVLTESDLAVLIKQCRELEYQPGKEIGILSFNETALKELLDITVVTTDFEQMGRSAAQLILENRYEQIRNPFCLIQRSSV